MNQRCITSEKLKLFHNEVKQDINIGEIWILKSEISLALIKLNRNKAAGPGRIIIEMLSYISYIFQLSIFKPVHVSC